MDLPKSGNPSLTPMPRAKPAALALSASILVSISGCLVPSHFSVVHSIVILGHSRDAVHRLPCISTCSSPPNHRLPPHQPADYIPPPRPLLIVYLPICLLGSSRHCAHLLASQQPSHRFLGIAFCPTLCPATTRLVYQQWQQSLHPTTQASGKTELTTTSIFPP